jgi:hypothetical protein
VILYELNPCPKCGSEDLTEYNNNCRPDDGYRLIICFSCKHETPWSRSLREAVDLWNAQPSEIDEPVEFVVEPDQLS